MANKRTIIKERIEEGGATKEILMEVSDTNAAGLASQFSYLRMGGVFPVADENGVYSLVDEATWEEHKASRAAKPKVQLSPEDMRIKLEKKVTRAASAQTNAAKKADKDPDNRVLELKAKVAEMQLEICEIELGQHEAEYPDLTDEAPTATVDIEDTESDELM
jgi:hypothetical protein